MMITATNVVSAFVLSAPKSHITTEWELYSRFGAILEEDLGETRSDSWSFESNVVQVDLELTNTPAGRRCVEERGFWLSMKSLQLLRRTTKKIVEHV